MPLTIGHKQKNAEAKPNDLTCGIFAFILTSVYGTAGARDLVNLRAALEHLPEVKRCLVSFRTGALGKLDEQLETLEDISGRIAAVLVDEPPFSVREGGMIREGYDDEVDRLLVEAKEQVLPEEFNESMRQAEEIVWEECPYIWLYSNNIISAASVDVDHVIVLPVVFTLVHRIK